MEEEKVRKLRVPKFTEMEDLPNNPMDIIRGRIPHYSKEELEIKMKLLGRVNRILPLHEYTCGTMFMCPDYLTFCIYDKGEQKYHNDDLAMDMEMEFLESRWIHIRRESIISIQALYQTCPKENCKSCTKIIEGRKEIPYTLEIIAGNDTHHIHMGHSEIAFSCLLVIKGWLDGIEMVLDLSGMVWHKRWALKFRRFMLRLGLIKMKKDFETIEVKIPEN